MRMLIATCLGLKWDDACRVSICGSFYHTSALNLFLCWFPCLHCLFFPTIQFPPVLKPRAGSLSPEALLPALDAGAQAHSQPLVGFSLALEDSLVAVHWWVITKDGAKVGLQLVMWEITQQLINNNTRVNSVLHTHNCKPTFVPARSSERSQITRFRLEQVQGHLSENTTYVPTTFSAPSPSLL